jgi:hypothetical protein
MHGRPAPILIDLEKMMAGTHAAKGVRAAPMQPNARNDRCM